MSPKSRSNVSTILRSRAALATMSDQAAETGPARANAQRRGRPHAGPARSSSTRPCRPEISRSGVLEEANLFVCQRGGVLQRLAYGVRLEFRIFTKNVLCGHSVRHEIDDQRDRHAHSANTGASSDDRWVKRDAVEHKGSLSGRRRVRMRCRRTRYPSPSTMKTAPLASSLSHSPLTRNNHRFTATGRKRKPITLGASKRARRDSATVDNRPPHTNGPKMIHTCSDPMRTGFVCPVSSYS